MAAAAADEGDPDLLPLRLLLLAKRPNLPNPPNPVAITSATSAASAAAAASCSCLSNFSAFSVMSSCLAAARSADERRLPGLAACTVLVLNHVVNILKTKRPPSAWLSPNGGHDLVGERVRVRSGGE